MSIEEEAPRTSLIAVCHSDINVTNVTPLVDICLVLLIVFMIVVPATVNGEVVNVLADCGMAARDVGRDEGATPSNSSGQCLGRVPILLPS